MPNDNTSDIKEVQKEMTVKAGQKCTAIRRILVPEKLVEDVQIALGQRLAKTTIGDPSVEGVRMGALAGNEQKEEVTEKVHQLAKSQEIVFGSQKTKHSSTMKFENTTRMELCMITITKIVIPINNMKVIGMNVKSGLDNKLQRMKEEPGSSGNNSGRVMIVNLDRGVIKKH